MSIFKCKMCGGSLEINNNETVGICEYCGTKQTFPKLSDEKKANLYDRANHFRRNNDFDKAMSIYEQILNEDKTDSEAYWSLVLCRYGIEYVEDPITHKRIPTVNRTQYTSIFADEDYKAALEYADSVQKEVYKAEAHSIDEIQKGILEISNKEEPFDVFICYKETDDNGRRTRDSVLANDLYHLLTQEGFKVFFSRITLEDKLGSAYEPYIFAALNSAKVMVVIGTRPEYYNAVWVKNEWSRYLSLIKNGAKKTIIPAYRDMDPYDLPDEFSHLQAQDMSKLGFMQDLIRGIKKITSDYEPKKTVKETVIVNNNSNSNTDSLLKRMFMFLEDGDFKSADEYAERVLDLEPENATAYLGKLMADLRIRKREDLKNLKKPFKNNKNFEKIVRYADNKLVAELNGYIDHIVKRNEEAEYNRKNGIYNKAVELMNRADSEDKYRTAIEKLKQISGFKDADKRIKECYAGISELDRKNKEREYNKAVKLMDMTYSLESCENAKAIFLSIRDYKDSLALSQRCEELIENIHKSDEIYNKALEHKKINKKSEYQNAINLFESILDYKDSRQQADSCKEQLGMLESKSKKNRKIALITSLSAVVCVIAIVSINYIYSAVKAPGTYSKGVEAFDSGNYMTAIDLFNDVDDYKDSKDYIIKSLNEINGFDSKISQESYYNGYSVVAAKNDGTVLAVREMYANVSDWKDIVAISSRKNHIVGLRNDGKVVEVGNNYHGECDVSHWKNIVAISAGEYHTVGLRSDGTVVAVGYNEDGQRNVSDWKDIVAISAGQSHTVGLRKDGTVVAVGNNYYGQCNVSDWNDIIAISAGWNHTVGLRSDGTVVAVGFNNSAQCNVSGWKDIVAISAGNFHTVGLRSDGTVVAVGYNEYGQCYASYWKDIVDISAAGDITVGLRNDRTVAAVGNCKSELSNLTY